MKALLRSLSLGLVLAAGTAHAGTALELLERKVTKYATPYLDAYKGLCICTEPGNPNEGRAGRLRYGIFAPAPTVRHVKVWCHVSVYSATDGDPVSSSSCATFQPLAS